MLISDSMSLLWLSYAVLSLLVLIAGYLALGFLPRLPRLMISWAVAGMMWVPARYSLPLLEQGESHHGMAPAVVVAGLSFLEGDRSAFAATLFVLVVAAVAGAASGVLLWRLGRDRAEARRQARATARAKASSKAHNDEFESPGRGELPLMATPSDRPRPGKVARTGQRGAVRREPSVG